MHRWRQRITTPTAFGLKLFHKRIGNLDGEAFLHLQAVGKAIDQACEFGQADYFSIGNIAYRDGAKEWRQVVLAMAVNGDVFYHDQFVVLLGAVFKNFQHVGWILSVAGSPVLPCLSNTGRGFCQAGAIRIFAYAD